MQVILFTDISTEPGYGKYGGTYKVATEVRSAGYTCQVIDNFLWLGIDRLKQLVDKFVSEDTCIIGISCTVNEIWEKNGTCRFWGLPDHEFVELIEYAKAKNNKIKIVAGGARVNVLCDWHYVDFAVTRKADIAIVKIIEHVATGSALKYDQNTHTKIVKGDDYFYSQESFSKSQIKYEPNDIILPNEALSLEVARGCIFACAFCKFDLIGKRIGDWTKDADTLYDEFMRNYSLYGTTDYLFTDELINESLEKLEMLVSVVKRLPFKLSYTGFARIDLIHRYPQMRELILESGAINLLFGIETLNDTVGRKIGKGLKSDLVKKAFKYCNKLWKDKIIVSGTFIVGLPGESAESIWKSVEYVTSPDSGIDMFHFFPLHISESTNLGNSTSKLEKEPEKYGYQFENKTWKSNTMSSHEARLLSEAIYNHPSVASKNRSFTSWISRYRALGYTIDELFEKIRSGKDFSEEVQERVLKTKEEYFRRLMNL